MRICLAAIIGLVFSGGALANPYLGLPPLPIPHDNPQTAEKIALGKSLFNDKRFSAGQSLSCASCHAPDRAYTDGLPLAQGVNGQIGTRNTPTVVNAAYYQCQFLDGRAGSLEEQVLGPLLNPIEHGLKSEQAVIELIQQNAEYVRQFAKVFAVPSDRIAIEHVAKAIASFERTLISGNSPFDRYLFGQDPTAMSTSAERGMRLFKRKGNCVSCHEISWNNALFTDNRFYNIGIGSQKLAPVLDKLTASRGASVDGLILSEPQRAELGRFNVSKLVAETGKFKTPTLRNIALTAPYMHDGSLKTLEEVIDYYDKGGNKNRFLDSKIFPLHLTAQEKADLLIFLRSLTSPLFSSYKP